MPETVPAGVEIIGAPSDHGETVLTPDALAFVASLHRSFNTRRRRLLQDRAERQARFDAGELPDFLRKHRPHPCRSGLAASHRLPRT